MSSCESSSRFWVCSICTNEREGSPDSDAFVQEVLREETQFQPQHVISDKPEAFVAEKSEDATFLTPKVQCFEWRDMGMLLITCKMKTFYNYCKKNGLINLNFYLYIYPIKFHSRLDVKCCPSMPCNVFMLVDKLGCTTCHAIVCAPCRPTCAMSCECLQWKHTSK